MSVRYDKARRKWIADYYDARGKRHQPTFEKRRQTSDEISEAPREIRRGTFLDPNEVPCLEEVATNHIFQTLRRPPLAVAVRRRTRAARGALALLAPRHDSRRTPAASPRPHRPPAPDSRRPHRAPPSTARTLPWV